MYKMLYSSFVEFSNDYKIVLCEKNHVTRKINLIKDFDKVLSLDLLKEKEENIDSDLKSYVEEQIKLRNEAKKSKNFEAADKIRNDLLEKGIELKDTREGTIWNKR